MKLRNKKTGEIVELLAKPSFVKRNDDYLQSEVNTFNSLAELNEEWEDYEEPKMYWCVNGNAEIISMRIDWESPETTEACKQIGNYFETKEEAEKAVEKLKAWKRLKDNGFKFDRWNNVSPGPYMPFWFYFEKDIACEDVKSDLDLLFGGEE